MSSYFRGSCYELHSRPGGENKEIRRNLLAETRTKVDLLLRHGRMLTMDAERRVLLDGAVAIQAGRIVAVGPDREVAPGVEAAQVRQLAGALVHPGLVDAHVHTGLDLIRGLLPESSGDWTPVETPFIMARNTENEYLSALLSCMEMVANGATLYADTGSSFNLEATAEAIEQVGMRGIPGYFISDMPGEIKGLHSTTDASLTRLTDQLARYPFHDGGRARCTVTLSGMGTASDHLLTEARKIADQQHLPMIMHQSWEEEEVTQAQAQYGKRPVEHLADLGILGPNLTLIHMIQVNTREIELVAEADACIVHCPAAAARRAMGAIRVGRFPDMLRAGIVVALGSDGHSGTHDIPRQAYLAATLHREMRGQIPTITAETALEMATVYGARALGMQDEVGSLEVGRRADLVIHRRDRPESRPHFSNPVTNLVYYALSRTVDTVLVGGEIILDGGNFTRFDAHAAYVQLDAKAIALEEAIGFQEPNAWPLIT